MEYSTSTNQCSDAELSRNRIGGGTPRSLLPSGGDLDDIRFGLSRIPREVCRGKMQLHKVGGLPCIVKNGRLSLIDTGSHETVLAPERVLGLTLGEVAQAQILGRLFGLPDGEYRVPDLLTRLTQSIGTEYISSTSKMRVTRIDGVIGMEQMRDSRLLFDTIGGSVTELTRNFDVPGRKIPIEDGFLGVVIKVRHGEHTFLAQVATGTKYSYLPSRMLRGRSSRNEPIRDIDREYRTISGEGYPVHLEVGGVRMHTTVGVLTPQRREELMYAGCDAIIGVDLLNLAPQVILDFAHRSIILPKS